MNKETKNQYVKRTQKDYSMSFKLSVVEEVEHGSIGIKAAARKYGVQSHSTITNWLRKYGTFDREYQTSLKMSETPEQKLLKLEQQVRKLEKQKASLEQQVYESTEKAIIFDMMINVAEKEFKIPIRKKHSPK